MVLIFGSLTSFTIAYSQSDGFGKFVMLGLVALSILCWVVLIHKIWMIHKVRKISQAFQTAFETHRSEILKLDLKALPKPTREGIPHPFGEIFHSFQKKTLEVLNKNHYFLNRGGEQKKAVHLTPSDLELLESHVMMTTSSQMKTLEKNVFILSTIATLAPFMGLLGTVWGILVSFSGLHTGGAVSSNSAILGGLSTALATTVLGLIIAIPALIAYNYLRNDLRNFSLDMDNFLSFLLSNIELQYRKVECD
jgi:biopolymer transport protein TolQ